VERGTVWDAGEEGWGRRSHRLTFRAVLTRAELGYLPVDAEVTAASTISFFGAEILH